MNPDPDLVIILSFIVITVIGFPIARAIARRISGGSGGSSGSGPSGLSAELLDRIERIENITEATQIEVERISEGQRFTTRLLTDRSFTDSGVAVKTGR